MAAPKVGCKCSDHDVWITLSQDESKSVCHIERSKVKQTVVNYLKSHNYLSERSSYLCKACINMAEYLMKPKPEDVETKGQREHGLSCDSLETLIDTFIAYLSKSKVLTDHVPDSKWSQLFFYLGKRVLSYKIQKDGEYLSTKYKDASYLQTLNPMEFILQRENILVSFVEGISGRYIKNEHNSGIIFYLATLIENIYYLANLNWIFPHSFVSNLVESCISGSKIVTTINGKIYPAGSYSSYLNWLKEIGRNKLECPSGDIETYIDNIGKYIIRNYRISKTKSALADIITSTLHISLMGNIETIESLKPCYWSTEKTLGEIQGKMDEILQSSRKVFRKVRFNYISQMIEQYKNETNEITKRISDLILLQKRQCTNTVSFFLLVIIQYSSVYFSDFHLYLLGLWEGI